MAGLSEALAGELAPLGIKVTVVELGYFRTDFLDSRSLAVSLVRGGCAMALALTLFTVGGGSS